MFGDHLPSLTVINKDEKVLDNDNKYLADFFMWDNIGLSKDEVTMEANEFTTYILDKLNMVSGIMPTFHKEFKNKENYNKDFELIQYDMIFGKNYIMNGNGYEKSNMKMGLKDIVLKNYEVNGEDIIVHGENFNYKSSIIINGKKIPTEFKDANTLIGDEIPKDIKDISVGQIGKFDKVLGKSNTLEIK